MFRVRGTITVIIAYTRVFRGTITGIIAYTGLEKEVQ